MNADRSFVDPARLQCLEREILQWNGQINLVTRVDTARQVSVLLAHCLEAWQLLVRKLHDVAWFRSGAYLDLGSGAGFPGLVWALARQSAGHSGSVSLVEPRGKRAWFLRRTARLLGLADLVVAEGRWGGSVLSVAGIGPGPVMLSLKALRLTDGEVLQGLQLAQGDADLPVEVLVVRFLGPRVATGTERDTDLPAVAVGDGWLYTLAACETVGEEIPRLGLSRYVLSEG
jgi:hypothetical protein